MWSKLVLPTMYRLQLCLILLPLFQTTRAVWPFPSKRFTANAFVDAQSLGLDDPLASRIIAFGDFDGDQFLDVVTLNDDQTTLSIHLWNHEKFQFTKNTTLQTIDPIVNVVPGDFTHDGRLDLLVMTTPASHSQSLDLTLYIGTAAAGFDTHPVAMQSSTRAQPIPLDFDGDLRIDLLGHILPSTPLPEPLSVWKNVWEQTSGNALYQTIPANLTQSGLSPCRLPNPHSSAVLDIDGDCLADIFLVCSDSPGRETFQIWLNNASGGFRLGAVGELPHGAGMVSFADMDRDGTMDMVFPTCESVSVDGFGVGCSINIAYNQQRPVCTSTGTFSTAASGNCRQPEDLCIADPNFSFNLKDDPLNTAFSRIPVSSIIPSSSASSILMLDTTFSPPLPIPIKLGDANLDGFPDLLFITSHGSDNTPNLVWSVSCGKGIAGCDGKTGAGHRGYSLATGGEVSVLETFKDVRSVAFLDMDEDGTLDLLIQRTGSQGQGKFNFIQNNVFHDAFFMKAIVLNGACSGLCVSKNSSEPAYHPFGVSYSGATYKYTILDTTGRRSAAQASQLPQTSYHALQTPYSFFGLGRTNNYIENLFVGSTRKTPSKSPSSSPPSEHYINMEGVIPNSKVVIIPPSKPGQGANEWKRELYLRPGEWIPWVTVTLVVATVILGIIVFVFHWNEKREDELERRRALHSINFDAL